VVGKSTVVYGSRERTGKETVASDWYLHGNIKESHGNSLRMVDIPTAVRTVAFKYTLDSLWVSYFVV
jgi:hypothetical protein